MTLHSLVLRAFCHATEDLSKVVGAVQFASGIEEVKESKSEGIHGNPIIVIEANVTKSKEIDRLMSRLSAQDLETLLGSLEKRIDDDGTFYFRIKKQEVFLGRLVLADGNDDGGDVISAHGKIAAYPKRPDTILASIQGYLNKLAMKRQSGSAPPPETSEI
jgi:RNA binding exosome subunit